MQISSIGSKEQQEKSKIKKYILIALIIATVLLLILLIVTTLFNTTKPNKLTLVINGENKELTQDLFVFDGDNIYVSLKDISNMIGYRYYDGGYKQFTQDKTSCYLECDDEVVVYELDKDIIYKTQAEGSVQYSEFFISEPVKTINNKLYVIESGLEIGCNLEFQYNKKLNQISIKTLLKLYQEYNDKVASGTYLNVQHLDTSFDNKKAILSGMLVVDSTIKEKKKFGVISISGEETYLDIKYDEIKYIEKLQHFLVKGENKYGVMKIDGTQVIKLEYDEISLIDSINKLYYVEKNGKKGMLDEKGKPLGGNIYVEYDEIGITSTLFKQDDINNSMLLYDKCIPVKKGDKWGMYDISGNLISNFNWDSLGYVNQQNSRENILLVDSIEGIIVSKDSKYGIINTKGQIVLGCVFDRIYCEVTAGKEQYYVQFGEEVKKLSDYLE